MSYELTFNNYSQVISSTDENAKFIINGISLEYEVVTNVALTRMIKNQYSGKMAVLYDSVFRHRVIALNKSDTMWNININTPAKSMKVILFLFKKSDAISDSKFYNPKINKTSITIKGVPNQIYAQGMRRYQHREEGKFRNTSEIPKKNTAWGLTKALNLSDMRLEDYLVDKYGLFLEATTIIKFTGAGEE